MRRSPSSRDCAGTLRIDRSATSIGRRTRSSRRPAAPRSAGSATKSDRGRPMCTRYASDLTMDDWAMLYDLAMQGPPAWNFEPNYNVVITQTIPVVMLRDGKRVLERMRWGIIPAFHKGTI